MPVAFYCHHTADGSPKKNQKKTPYLHTSSTACLPAPHYRPAPLASHSFGPQLPFSLSPFISIIPSPVSCRCEYQEPERGPPARGDLRNFRLPPRPGRRVRPGADTRAWNSTASSRLAISVHCPLAGMPGALPFAAFLVGPLDMLIENCSTLCDT